MRKIFLVALTVLLFTGSIGVRPAAAQGCVGDCNGDQMVNINEIITMVNIALGSADISNCTAGDLDGDGQISISEIIAAVHDILNAAQIDKQGTCMIPGPNGLQLCPKDTPIKLFRCEDLAHCLDTTKPHARTELIVPAGQDAIGDAGAFHFHGISDCKGRSTYVLEATVGADTTYDYIDYIRYPTAGQTGTNASFRASKPRQRRRPQTS